MGQMIRHNGAMRIVSAAPVQAFRSFGMTVTRRVHATCEEFGCEHWAKGWITAVPPDSPDEGVLVAACDGRVDQFRRRWTRIEVTSNGFHAYHFPPGQPCLRASTHTIPWNFAWHHRDGDWRGNPTGIVVPHPDGTSWVDEFGEHQQRIADQRKRYGAE